MTVKVKICGVTTFEDALFSAEAGADMLGFNFFKRSPRYIEPEKAQKICDALREQLGDQCPLLVGVFVNATDSDISRISNQAGLDAMQLSGDESDEMIAELRGMAYKGIQPMNKAMAIEDAKYYSEQFPSNECLPSLLIDAYHPHLKGGTGEQANTEVALAVKEIAPRLMLAGGLNPQNVAQRIAEIAPWGVDVASGVEDGEAGVKSPVLVTAFIQAVKGE